MLDTFIQNCLVFIVPIMISIIVWVQINKSDYFQDKTFFIKLVVTLCTLIVSMLIMACFYFSTK